MTFLMEKGLGVQCVKMCPVDTSACHIKSHSSFYEAECRPGGGHLPSDSTERKERWGHTEGVAAQLQGEGLKRILLEVCVQSLSCV